MSDIPAGFRPIEPASPFIELVGPLYECRSGGQVSLGLRIERKHTNRRGLCHGGVLATLADVALGHAMLGQTGARGGFVTANLAIDYAGAAKLGDWLHSEVEVQRMGSRLAFANGYLVRGETRIVRASAIFALPGRPAG